MSNTNPVEDLFAEDTGATKNFTVSEVLGLLGEYGGRHLAYAGDIGWNPGYIFRGELDYDQPLRSSLERYLFKDKYAVVDGTRLKQEERKLVSNFVNGDGGRVASIIDEQRNHKLSPPRDDVFWWLSVMRHYGHPTRFLDFTRDILFALFFAIEQYDTHPMEYDKYPRSKDLIIYCFPCRNLKFQDDPENNKVPIAPGSNGINMHRAIGCLIDLEWMKKHKIEEKRSAQKFGWDRPHFANPRLDFQKGMLAYPFDYPEAPIDESKEAWLVRNLRAYQSDPFHMGMETSNFPARRIRIESKHGEALKRHLVDQYQLTEATVYVDYSKVELGPKMWEGAESAV